MKNQYLKNTLILCMVFQIELMNAQQYDHTFATQNIALGNQSVALSNSFNAVGNPALMTENKKTIFGITVINKYFITNLKQGALGIIHKFTKSDCFGMAIQFDGTQNFKQSSFVLSYAKKINEKFSTGISIIYMNSFEQTIGSKNNLLGKAGISCSASKSIVLGTTVYNPFFTKLNTISNERIPTYIAAGLRYKVSPQVSIYSEYKLGLDDTRNFKLGLSYAPKPEVRICAGFQNSNAPLSFGFSYITKSTELNISMQYHQALGFSPACGFEFAKD